MTLRPGCVEFGWGHPAMDLLPVAGLQRAAAGALERDGTRALVYGASQGPGGLVESIRERMAVIDGSAPSPGQILVTGGVSQALDLLCTLCARPGEIVLVESPVYHFALQIFRDHGLELLPVAADEEGLRLDALDEALQMLRRANRRARLLYTVPTFNNPTGRSLATTRRSGLMQLAAHHDLLILEDDVYRELWFDVPPPPALASYGPQASVVRLGSFSKIIAPGLRLGWLVADEALVQRARQSGLLTSGGGVNHFTAHVVAEYLRSGLLDEHVPELRAAYRARRNTLADALARHLPVECRFTPPGGGFFIWLWLPDGIDSAALLPQAEAAGVAYLPGARFHVDGGGQRHLRLAFSLLSADEMEQGARRLGEVLRTALRDG